MNEKNHYSRVSIITRTKNRALLLDRAIRSVLSQTYHDWQHIIVNDGGNPDEIYKVIGPYQKTYQGRLIIINNPISVGMEAASNIGIRATSSEYVTIHDDDDSWEPLFLESCLNFMDDKSKPLLKREYGGVITYSQRIIEKIEGEIIHKIRIEPFNTWMSHVSLYRLASSNIFPPISFVFKREVLEKVGYFREDLPVLGDWDFHLRVCLKHDIGLIPELLANYHHRVDLKSGVYANTVFTANDQHRIYENLYRNELLREDFELGKAGLGLIVNMGQSFERLHGQVWIIESFIAKFRMSYWRNRLSKFIKKISKF